CTVDLQYADNKTDQQISQIQNQVAGETRVVAVTDAALLTTERAGGFVGTVVGPFVSGEPGHPVTVTGFDYVPTASATP
ncbi:hypothetical protein QN345_15575, partial [Cryobacterium sp. 10I1]|nr:hypothetical protein [Cryobacterium sp. 10I1]